MKTSKKILSLVLAVIMCFTLVGTAFAANEKAVTPVIVVSGMGAYPLYNENEETVFPMRGEVITDSVLRLILPLVGSIAKNDWNVLAQGGMEPIHDLFKEMACDENGDSINKIHVPDFSLDASNYTDTFGESESNEGGLVRGISEKIGWENTNYFYYDWRMNPMDIADELDARIKEVMERHNSDKVSIIALSFGGTIASAYLYKYGSEHIENLVYGNTAFCGVDLVGGLFVGDIEVNIASVIDYLSEHLKSDIYAVAARIAKKYGNVSAKVVDDYLENIIKVLNDPAYSEIMMDTFAHYKGIWTLMPGKYYEEAKKNMYNYATFSDTFFDNIDEYFCNVQDKTAELIKNAESVGTNVYVIGSYGYSSIPLTGNTSIRTDNLINTDLMTGYCTVAPFGKSLSSVEYTKGGCTEHEHISTDNIVDASTAILPERTWVFKNMSHVNYAYGTASHKLAIWLVTNDEAVDVHTTSEFPQFIELDKLTAEASSLTKGVRLPSEQGNFMLAVKKFFSRIFDIILKVMGIDFAR